MKNCSRCGQETDREPFDRNQEIVCYDCKYACKGCGERIQTAGGHAEYCSACIAKKEKVSFKTKNRQGPLGIILKI